MLLYIESALSSIPINKLIKYLLYILFLVSVGSDAKRLPKSTQIL